MTQTATATDPIEGLLEPVRACVNLDLPFYSAMVRDAFASVDPVFQRPRYVEFFWHCAASVGGWLPRVLVANAGAEAHGSEKLWELWRAVDYNQDVERNLIRHSFDESRHSRLFVRLIGHAFPSALSKEQAKRLANDLPDVRTKPREKCGSCIDEALLIDHLLQMNMGEIRTRAHMQLIGPAVFAFAPERGRDWVEGTVFGLLSDEVRHIAYTARLLEEWAACGSPQEMRKLFERRLNEFSRLTVEQTEAAVLNYGQGRFPDLLEI